MHRIRLIALIALATLTGAAHAPLAAQVSQADSLVAMLAASTRSGVSRAELEASLVEIERILASGGYSGALKSIKRDEAVLIRHRLAEGDIRPGDVIRVAVASDAAVTNNYVVTPSMAIVVPSLGAISMRGLLRSEVEPHLQREIARFLRDPVVMADALIRVSVLGGVGRPGFYSVPAGQAISEVIMTVAGGLGGNADLEKSSVHRGDREIVSSDAFTTALRDGLTLDQLNMQAGDEIMVGVKKPGTLSRALAIVTGVGSLAYLLSQVF